MLHSFINVIFFIILLAPDDFMWKRMGISLLRIDFSDNIKLKIKNRMRLAYKCFVNCVNHIIEKG